MAEEKSIFYRPELEPQKEYLSEGEFSGSSQEASYEESEEEKKDRVSALIEEFEELTTLISGTLPSVVAVVNPIAEKLTERIRIVFPEGYREAEPLEITPAEPVQTENKAETEKSEEAETSEAAYEEEKSSQESLFPELFPEPTNIVIEVETPRSYIEIVSEKYKQDTIDLEEHYLHRLQTVFQRFYQQALCVMAECGISDMEHLTMDFDGESVSVGTLNLLHLRDTVVRSQILRDQKTRLLKKTHNVSNTMLLLRKWQAAEQSLERYYRESFGKSATCLDTESDVLLGSLQRQYSKNYNEAFLNVYKYLDSSVIRIEDILEMNVQEIKAKGKLLEAGVNIFSVSSSTQR